MTTASPSAPVSRPRRRTARALNAVVRSAQLALAVLGVLSGLVRS